MLILGTGAARAASDPGPFGQGRTRLSMTGGYGSENSKDYLVLGAGVGYYLVDGLEAGLDSEAWLGSKPHLYKVSPQLTYVLDTGWQYKPYLGGFYRHTFEDSQRDRDSAGARAGMITPVGEHAYLSLGLVYEAYFRCDKDVTNDCSEVYPEISLAFSF
jgi:hypothetical protein